MGVETYTYDNDLQALNDQILTLTTYIRSLDPNSRSIQALNAKLSDLLQQRNRLADAQNQARAQLEAEQRAVQSQYADAYKLADTRKHIADNEALLTHYKAQDVPEYTSGYQLVQRKIQGGKNGLARDEAELPAKHAEALKLAQAEKAELDRIASYEAVRHAAEQKANEINSRAGAQVATVADVSRNFMPKTEGLSEVDRNAEWVRNITGDIQPTTDVAPAIQVQPTSTEKASTPAQPVQVVQTQPVEPTKVVYNTTTSPFTNVANTVANTSLEATKKVIPEVKTGTTTKTSEKTSSGTAKTTSKTTPTPNVIQTTKTAPVQTVVRATQPAQGTLGVGQQWYGVPNGEFQAGPVRVDAINVQGDNGGLQHGAVNALYQPHNATPSLGELIAFSSIMNGRKDFGGLSDVTATMQNADKMNAYAAQANIANQVQQLMAQGRSMEEARYEAVANQMLANGQNRGAVSVALPEYAKQADLRAGRELDATMSAGGNYTHRGAFGYTPYGIRSITANKDGSYNIDINGNVIRDVPPEYANFSVYGAIKGGGSGVKSASEYGINYDKERFDRLHKIIKLENEVAKTNAISAGANIKNGGTSKQIVSTGIGMSIEAKREFDALRNAVKDDPNGPQILRDWLVSRGYATDIANTTQNSTTLKIGGVDTGIGTGGF